MGIQLSYLPGGDAIHNSSRIFRQGKNEEYLFFKYAFEFIDSYPISGKTDFSEKFERAVDQDEKEKGTRGQIEWRNVFDGFKSDSTGQYGDFQLALKKVDRLLGNMRKSKIYTRKWKKLMDLAETVVLLRRETKSKVPWQSDDYKEQEKSLDLFEQIREGCHFYKYTTNHGNYFEEFGVI